MLSTWHEPSPEGCHVKSIIFKLQKCTIYHSRVLFEHERLVTVQRKGDSVSHIVAKLSDRPVYRARVVQDCKSGNCFWAYCITQHPEQWQRPAGMQINANKKLNNICKILHSSSLHCVTVTKTSPSGQTLLRGHYITLHKEIVVPYHIQASMRKIMPLYYTSLSRLFWICYQFGQMLPIYELEWQIVVWRQVLVKCPK